MDHYVCFLIAFLTTLLRNTSYRVDEDFLGERFEDEFFRQCPEVAQGSFDVAQCVQYLRVNVRGFGCETQAPEISPLHRYIRGDLPQCAPHPVVEENKFNTARHTNATVGKKSSIRRC